MENKKRLMDADEFLGKLQKLAESLKKGEISEININLLIASTPIVDAVEVVHGQWKRTPVSERLYCGVCDSLPEYQLETNYCPNCGAKMDK